MTVPRASFMRYTPGRSGRFLRIAARAAGTVGVTPPMVGEDQAGRFLPLVLPAAGGSTRVRLNEPRVVPSTTRATTWQPLASSEVSTPAIQRPASDWPASTV